VNYTGAWNPRPTIGGFRPVPGCRFGPVCRRRQTTGIPADYVKRPLLAAVMATQIRTEKEQIHDGIETDAVLLIKPSQLRTIEIEDAQ
jgi:hypothetical protein